MEYTDYGKPYIFISYAVDNYAEVMEVISHLKELDLRIWYNDGNSSPDESDTRLSKCNCFIAFMSEEYISSSRCRDELNKALNKSKSRILIYLKDFELPDGIKNSFSNIPSISKSKYGTTEFYNEILKLCNIDKCRITDNAKQKESVKLPAPVSAVAKKIDKEAISAKASSISNNVRSSANNAISSAGNAVNAVKEDSAGKAHGIVSLVFDIVAFLTLFSMIPVSLITSILARVIANVAKNKGNNGTMVGFVRITSMIMIIIAVIILVINILFNIIIAKGNEAISSWTSSFLGPFSPFFEFFEMFD